MNGNQVWRGEGKAWAHPSIYSRELSNALREKLLENSWDHPLLIVGCYLNPMFREMEFISDSRTRTDCRSKAEVFAGKLVRKQRERSRLSSLSKSGAAVDEIGLAVIAREYDSLVVLDNSSFSASGAPNIGGKKRPFDD